MSAERGIAKVGLPFDILRPVVTDGLGAKGNFGALRKIAALPVPLPFGALRSRRSILSVENFNSAVLAVLRTEPSNSAYIAANPQPMTLGEIVSYIRAESGRRPNLFPLPEPLVGLTCRAVGRGDLWERIGKPLIASPAKLLSIGWQPT